MSDFDYRMDGLESRISSLEGALRDEISSERYETEREIADVRGLVRDLEETVRITADAARELRVEALEESQSLGAVLAETRSAVRTDEDRLEKIDNVIEHTAETLLVFASEIEGLRNDLAKLAFRCGIADGNLSSVERGDDVHADGQEGVAP